MPGGGGEGLASPTDDSTSRKMPAWQSTGAKVTASASARAAESPAMRNSKLRLFIMFLRTAQTGHKRRERFQNRPGGR